MIKLIASFKVKPGMKEALIKTAGELIEKSRKEPGNILYDLCESKTEENCMAFIESWQDGEALKKHEAAEYFISTVPRLADFMEGKPVQSVYENTDKSGCTSVIFKRRSIRSFIENLPVEKEKIERILRAGMCAPSGAGKAPWEFLVVTDKTDRQAVSKMNPHAKMAAEAPALIITLANPEASFKGNRWPLDLSACTQNMLLQIADEGLGGVWLGFYPEEERVGKLKGYFKLPENIVPFSVIAFGYSEMNNEYIDRYDESKVRYGKY